MTATSTQKDIAIACLEKLEIYKPYIKKFESKGIPCFFENFAGFYADQEQELFNKIREVESTYGCLVYAVTHEYFEFGTTWSMLCVSKDSEDIEEELFSTGQANQYYAFAYVWNETYEDCSEFGDIVVRSSFGGIRRVS